MAEKKVCAMGIMESTSKPCRLFSQTDWQDNMNTEVQLQDKKAQTQQW